MQSTNNLHKYRAGAYLPSLNFGYRVSSCKRTAPSLDATHIAQRQRALARALGEEHVAEFYGHARAWHFRATRGLSFCANHDSATVGATPDDDLVEMQFILPLKVSVRVLHSYYLADALGGDSGLAYGAETDTKTNTLLAEIDHLNAAKDQNGLTLAQVQVVVRSRLSAGHVDRQYLCLLRQYVQNVQSGRVLHGTNRVYERPHMSTVYRDGHRRDRQVEPDRSIFPAALLFSGYAAKFVNLWSRSAQLYWDGGRDPRTGEIRSLLAGTIPSLDSLGTASFPGHDFYLTPTYANNHMLQRCTATSDDSVLCYDPFAKLSTAAQGEWTEEQRFARDAWLADRSFGRDYLVKTGTAWLAQFPTPYVSAEGGEHRFKGDAWDRRPRLNRRDMGCTCGRRSTSDRHTL